MAKTAFLGPARMDVIQGVSGLLLVLFVWCHMFFESSILLGKDAMLWVTRMFEGEHLFGRSYPGLVSAAAAAVFVLVALHAVLALRKYPGSYKQYRVLREHTTALGHQDTRLWWVQVVTGFALFFLIPVHLFSIFIEPANIGPYASADRIWTGGFWVLYVLLLITVHVHAAIGMYRLAMKWVLSSTSNALHTRRRLKIAMWGTMAFFLSLGTASLVTYMYIGHEHADRAGERYSPAHVTSAMKGA